MNYFDELDPFEQKIIKVAGGFTLTAEIKPDSHMAPWDMDDVTPRPYYSRHDKAPHERKLVNGDFVDFRELVQSIRKNWGCTREQANENAHKTISRLNAWLDDEWHYIGVAVTLSHPATVGELDTDSLWGIESDSKESYLLETANELSDDLMARLPELVKYERARLEHDCDMLKRMIELHDKEAAL